MLFPRHTLVLLIPSIPMPAIVFVILYALLELFSGFFGTNQGVAYFAHLGGIPLIVVVIIAGIGIGTVRTNSDAFVSTVVNRSQLGASIGAAESFKEFGDMVGPLLVGAIMQQCGVRVRFVSCGAAAPARLVLANFVAARRAEKLR